MFQFEYNIQFLYWFEYYCKLCPSDFSRIILFNCLLSYKLLVIQYGEDIKTGFLSGPYTDDTTF